MSAILSCTALASAAGSGLRPAELLAASRQLTPYSCSVSHDLRALRSLDGFGCACREGYGRRLGETAQHHLKRIRDAAVRNGTLIDERLELARVARRESRQAPVTLGAIARRLVDGLGAGEPRRPVEVAIAPAREVQGDPAPLRVILQHLPHNARKSRRSRERAAIEPAARTVHDRQSMDYVLGNGEGLDPALPGQSVRGVATKALIGRARRNRDRAGDGTTGVAPSSRQPPGRVDVRSRLDFLLRGRLGVREMASRAVLLIEGNPDGEALARRAFGRGS